MAEMMRPDGRPEVYELPPHEGGANNGYVCYVCEHQGHMFRRYPHGKAFMTSPVNTPGGKSAVICYEHLPAEVVIVDPTTGNCRNKAGDNTWNEEVMLPSAESTSSPDKVPQGFRDLFKH